MVECITMNLRKIGCSYVNQTECCTAYVQ